ncbi:MAG TPA: hypothetical protein DDY14_02695 [Chromatiaceae bacterium]|jgi:uncharacterized protein (DUF2141 family)|nr:MAG: hypothetical protein N838_30580 [Thiohalocapsa sp. PB-PSB1]HBG94235.1 hypothetical protein [Chromatiaceae bacterium]
MNLMLPSRFARAAALGCLLSAQFVSATASEATTLSAADQAIRTAMVTVGEKLRLVSMPLDQRGIVDLELQRFEVFAPDATILVDDETSFPIPRTAYYKGHIEGQPKSLVVLSVPETGPVRGLITAGKKAWLIGQAEAPPYGLLTRAIDTAAESDRQPFICGTERESFQIGELAPHGIEAASQRFQSTTQQYMATLAIETDYEFYALFGSMPAATDYIGDLFAYISATYQQEVNTQLQIGYSRLWTNGATADPWNATSGTPAALGELRSYWLQNMTGVDRATVHMLSGKRLGGGIAYVGVLCNSEFGFGLTANISGDFDIDNPQVLWDVVAVAHEIGHNFNSHHTHCYAGVFGNPNDVDHCYGSENGCYFGLTSLPGLGSLTGGTPGQGTGTIMSYCHLLGGGMSDISFTFGQSHPYGIDAERVPNAMYDHVTNTAASNPMCLPVIDEQFRLEVFRDGNGNGSVESNPTGIDCGSICTADFSRDTRVTLNAMAAAGSSFTGWNGDCSGTATNCQVTMSSAKSVTATFTDQGGSSDAWLSPSTQSVGRGRNFQFSLAADGDGGLIGGYSMQVDFDPSLVQLDTARCDQGVCAGSDALSTNIVNADAAGGSISLVGFDVSGTGPGSDLELLVLHFIAGQTPGITGVDLQVDTLSDEQGQSLGTVGVGADVEIRDRLCGDVNGDDQVSIIDALLIARYVAGLPVSGTCFNDSTSIPVVDASAPSALLAMAAVSTGDAWLAPAMQTVGLGSPFEVELYADGDGGRVGAYNIDLTFDPMLVQIDVGQCDQGVCAGSDALSSNFVSADNATGVLGLAGFDITGVGPGGDLHLLTVHFIAQQTPATTNLDVQIETLTDENGTSLGTQGTGASVEITDRLCGDVNGDTQVSIVDALLVARYAAGLPVSGTCLGQ